MQKINNNFAICREFTPWIFLILQPCFAVRETPSLFVAFLDAPFAIHVSNPRISSVVIHVLHLRRRGTREPFLLYWKYRERFFKIHNFVTSILRCVQCYHFLQLRWTHLFALHVSNPGLRPWLPTFCTYGAKEFLRTFYACVTLLFEWILFSFCPGETIYW